MKKSVLNFLLVNAMVIGGVSYNVSAAVQNQNIKLNSLNTTSIAINSKMPILNFIFGTSNGDKVLNSSSISKYLVSKEGFQFTNWNLLKGKTLAENRSGNLLSNTSTIGDFFSNLNNILVSSSHDNNTSKDNNNINITLSKINADGSNNSIATITTNLTQISQLAQMLQSNNGAVSTPTTSTTSISTMPTSTSTPPPAPSADKTVIDTSESTDSAKTKMPPPETSQPIVSRTYDNDKKTTSEQKQTVDTVQDEAPEALPISIYHDNTDVSFKSGHWGDITASISPEGIGGTNCIKYSNLLSNPYSPGPEVIFSKPKNISNMQDSDRLQLSMDIGTVPTSQAVRIIFNGDPSINIVTPKLNKTSVFEVLNLDVSSIRAKLGGKISSMSFESAGPNGWEHVSNLYVDEISIIRPTTELPTIAPVQATKQETDAFPINIYQDESNVSFNSAHWGSITAEISKEGIGGTNCIKYSNLMGNVYAPSPEVVFLKPINIMSMVNTDKFQLSVYFGSTSPAQAIRIIFNGDESLNIVTPQIDTTSGFQTLNLDISKIREKLGGQIAHLSFESAGPNGWNHVNDLYIDDIKIVRP